VPFLHKLAEFVSCDVHSIEVGIAVIPFDFLNLDLHFSPVLIVAFVLQVCQRYFKHSSFQTISGILLTSCLVARGDCGYTDIENGGDMHVVPFLSCEWVGNLLLLPLLFEISWVFACCH